MTSKKNTASGGTMPGVGALNDQDYLSEFLKTQKQLSANYNYHAGECVNSELRATLLNLLTEEHDMQSDIFNQMHARGWYQVKPADTNEISATKTKFPE